MIAPAAEGKPGAYARGLERKCESCAFLSAGVNKRMYRRTGDEAQWAGAVGKRSGQVLRRSGKLSEATLNSQAACALAADILSL
jgi:hypothetical protein